MLLWCLQGQMVTQLPIKLWPCPSSMMQLCTLDRTAIYSATAFVEDTGSGLVYFYFYLILGYSFLPIQGIHYFYNRKTNTYNCESCYLGLQWYDRILVGAVSLTAVCWCYPSLVQESTNMRPTECQSPHTYMYAVSEDLLWFLHAEITKRIVSCFCILEYKESSKTVQRFYLKMGTPNNTELHTREKGLPIID